MRKLAVGLALLGVLAAGSPVGAEIGTGDVAPAATLLLPYFEVNLDNPAGNTTLFSINNASAASTIAHVTVWTDWGIPTLSFDVSLTGFDVQTISVRDVFTGLLPATVGCNLPAYTAADLVSAHRGRTTPLFGGQCAAADHGDSESVVRGYITVDTVTACTTLFPSDPGYFAGVATPTNVPWGDYFYVDSSQNFAQGDNLVHIEACSTPGIGNGAGRCPFAAGNYTFYGRYVAGTAADQREPLATTFASRYLNGGAFTGGTDLLVWRDTKVGTTGINGPRACGTNPGWFPLDQSDVVAFDEQEEATDQCFLIDNVGPPIGGSQPCFPLATQRHETGGGNAVGADLSLPTPFGWLFLNLNTTVTGDATGNPGVSQAWVTAAMDALGRFSVGFSAIQLDNALDTSFGGMFLIP